MVSRTPRNQSQSQPRSTRSSTRPPHSFEAWENVNDNAQPARPSAAAMEQQRRAKSSMRYQSSGRTMSGARMASTPRGDTTHSTPKAVAQMNARPRAISAGRIRAAPQTRGVPLSPNAENPTEVARQILDLRERRESSSHKRSSVKQQPNNIMTSYSSNSRNKLSQPSSPKGRVLQQTDSNMSQEEIQADERLSSAETKISGLLQELEELKFFQELESETPSAPKTPRSAARDKTPSQSRGNKTPTRAAGVLARVAGLPTSIRASSPARGGRLPPPPQLNANGNAIAQPSTAIDGGGLETYKPMSPRMIAKLDRNSLELECQTLVRKLQLIEQERNSAAAMIEMYEISMEEHDMDKNKIKKLEGELGRVSTELRRQLQNITKGKESLVKDYEERLQANLSKLHRVQEKADSYKMELEITQADGGKSKEHLEKLKTKVKDEKTKADELKAREAVLELQLTEARNLNATLVKKVEKKRTEVTSLQQDLSQTNQILQSNKEEKDVAYETRMGALEQQLADSKDRYDRLELEAEEHNAEIEDQEKKLIMAKFKETEQAALIAELQSRVEDLEKETVAKFEEGKKAGKVQHTRKVQELVKARADESWEYERRLKAMQEQLRHQNDRHHAEIQETQKRNDERLQSMREEIKEELRLQEGDKVAKLDSELSGLKRDYEEDKADYATRLKEAQQKSRDTATDFQRQDEVRQQELDHMHDRLESYVNETGAKETRIAELNQLIEENRKRFEEMEATKAQQLAELMRRDDLHYEARQKSVLKETELKDEIVSMKATFSDLESELRAEANDLKAQVEQAHTKLAEAQAVAKESESIKKKIDVIQTAFDNVQAGLQSERARHEEVESELRVELAKMEGKLRASESSLKMKKTRVMELERQLDLASMTSSKAGEEKQSEIQSLRMQLDDTTTRLETERAGVQEKGSAVSQLQSEVSTLHDKLRQMSKLEDVVKDTKKKVSSLHYESTQKESELAQVTKSYEETRSKLLEAEQRYTVVKVEIESQIDKKEKLVERYDKSIQDLEFKLEKERDVNIDLKSAAGDFRRSIDGLEKEKIRKETELSNLRKDYEELSGLLEENLHSSAKKDDLDLELKRRQREMRETVDIYNQQIADLEEQVKQHGKFKESSDSKTSQLQTSLDNVEDEKMKLRSEVTELRQKFEDASSALENYKQQDELSRGGVEAELGRKDRKFRDTIQRYTRTISELESKLEEETYSRLELEDRLSSARSELEEKQKRTQELIQKHTKGSNKLESDLSKSSLEKEELRSKLEQTNKDLEQKQRELKESLSKYTSEFAVLQNVKQEHHEYKEVSEATREELERKEQQISEMKQKIPELLLELDTKSREKDECKATSKRYETELNKRKEQLNEVVSRYTDQIAELEAELDEHSVARSTTHEKAETVRAEARSKDQRVKELQWKVSDLESKLDIADKNKDAAKQKAESIAKDLDEREADVRSFEMEKIELETKLHSQSRSKEELRVKVSELSSKLERKEREVREVTDRYKMYIMELESKLDEDTDAKHHMLLEIDQLKNNLNSAVEVSSEASELREKVYTLEMAVDTYRGKARGVESKSKDTLRSLEESLESATKAKEETEEALKKANGEKGEVIAALEGVINEVQNREDEIESLSDLLHRRDEELQHAKIIATKALQSAKDIQKRFKDKDKDRDSGMMERMDELNDNVDTLASKNETLQRKLSMLERDLRDRKLECKRLKDQLRQFDVNQLRDPMKDDSSAFTHSTYGSSRVDSFPNPASSGSLGDSRIRINTGSMDPDGIGLGADSFSPSASPTSPADDFGPSMFEKEVEFSAFQKHGSGELSEAGSSTIVSSDVTDRWTQDYDNESGTGVDSVASEALSSRSRRSIERDALRKYVRQRYSSKR